MTTIDDYGQQYKDHLIEQYKLFVEMADNVSARRAQTNAFYITVLSALLAIVSIAAEKFPSDVQLVTFLAVSLLGGTLCYVWNVNIRSYRQLNSGKFKVIHEMEEQLPYPCYTREWEFLGKGENAQKYLQLTRIERYVPYLMAVPFVLLFCYSIYSLCF